MIAVQSGFLGMRIVVVKVPFDMFDRLEARTIVAIDRDDCVLGTVIAGNIGDEFGFLIGWMVQIFIIRGWVSPSSQR